MDFWPGAKAANRPSASFPESEQHAEPDKSSRRVAVLQSDVSVRARNRQPQLLTYSPPVSVVNRLNGVSGSAPEFPLRALGLQKDQLEAMYGADGQS